MKVDIRPINALVDLTNYVMMSVGQPTHAYDAQHLKGGIQARRAAEGETLELLDGKQLTLSPADLVIADQEKALGLAGVMGGKQDSILSSTTETVFEAAAFRPESIRKTAQTFGLRTEASSRNEKGIDAQRVEPAFALWDQMLHELFPEARLTAFSLEDAALTERAVVNVSVEWLVRRLGRELNVDEVRQFLLPLGFDVEEEPSEGETLLHVLAPTWRSTGDISLPDDILEELPG